MTDLLHESLYGNTPGTALGVSSDRKFTAASRLSLNVCRSVVSAVTSKIAAKNKPKPTFLTEEGDYHKRCQAEMLESGVSGVFYGSGVYAQLASCFRDACVYGTGVLKSYSDKTERKVVCERVSPKEIVVDDVEGAAGDPRNVYQRKYVDRGVLRHMFKHLDESLLAEIDRNSPDHEDMEAGYRSTADMVLVTEGWHLGESSKVPGRHVIAIDNATLLDEPWTQGLPLSFFRWSNDIDGFFGVGLIEELRGIQAEINKLLQQIQRGHHLITGHYLVQQGSVLTQQINNDLSSIWKYTGTAPTYQAPSIIAPEVYSHLWQLYARAFEISGVSQLNATGQKPAGLNSGEAQRVYQDTQTERFLEVGQAYEEFVIEAARQVVSCAKSIGGFSTRSVEKNSIKYVDWSEIDLEDDDYVIRVYPTSLLPTTPAGKLAWAQDMIEAGVIPPEDVLDIVDFPDTEAYASRRNAPRRVIEKNVDWMLRKGEMVSPEPFDNHELALRLVNEAYHKARLDAVPEDRLQLLRDYMSITQSFMAPAPEPPGMAPEPPMPAPGGGPMPPMGPEELPPMTDEPQQMPPLAV